MNYNHLSDTEFRHYMELYNTDPIVQRLCTVEHYKLELLEDELIEVKNDLESAESDNEYLQSEIDDLKRENRILKEKLQIWQTLSDE